MSLRQPANKLEMGLHIEFCERNKRFHSAPVRPFVLPVALDRPRHVRLPCMHATCTCIHMHHMHNHMHTQGLENLLGHLSALKGPLNDSSGSGPRSCSVGLGLVNTTSVQLASYPGDGRGYVRHRDTPESAQGSGEAERKVQQYFNPRTLSNVPVF